MKYTFNTTYKKKLADTVTPVNLYLKLRDKYRQTVLLESSDYHGDENAYTYICFNPIAGIKVENNQIETFFPDGKKSTKKIDDSISVPNEIQGFVNSFEVSPSDHKFINNGLFGYATYDAVRYFEDISIQAKVNKEKEIPDILYHVYQYVIAFDVFSDELYIFEHTLDGKQGGAIVDIEAIIDSKNYSTYNFELVGEEETNFNDEEFLELIAKGKAHCKRGDVFQIVLSREFSQSFKGDDFNLYRALRSVNPSPYLFYFDYGSFKIFGSSPEAQLVVKNGEASIHPIAGTFRRTLDDKKDAELAEKLKADPKENSEHVMLVDLARNDLSRNCGNVNVKTYREIQYYSHVIHLVSQVVGKLKPEVSTISIVADTFPAGTLSGAPKYKAMQLIDTYERGRRSFYGGCIGFIGFDGSFNNAIMIRSFLSKNNKLFYQAGAGVVESSVDESELNEVHNKLAALKKAMKIAEQV